MVILKSFTRSYLRLFLVICLSFVVVLALMYGTQTTDSYQTRSKDLQLNNKHREKNALEGNQNAVSLQETVSNISISDVIESLKVQVVTPRQATFHRKPKEVVIPKGTSFQYDIQHLLEKLGKSWQWAFIKERIVTNWDGLVQSAKYLVEKDLIQEKSTKRQILVFPGLLLGTDYAKRASHSQVAPLGELVQWADLIAGLYLLGHDVELQSDSHDVDMGLKHQLKLSSTNSDIGCENQDIDYIYTDLIGHFKLSDTVKQAYKKKFRVLDLYGTEQAYNNERYARRKGTYKHCGKWGLRGLHIRQFYTMYPLQPDNTFLGFIIFNNPVTRSERYDNSKPIAYLYGKDISYIKGRLEPSQVIPVLSKYTEIHSSLSSSGISVPKELVKYNVVNHGHLNPEKYIELAQRTKLIVGLGRPEEGPGVLEAIAKGCIFINPKRPVNWRYDGKPTNRSLTSQNPYAEKFIGPPHVFTVDYNDTRFLDEVIKIALKTKVEPFTPFELTPGGYLQRLYTLLQHQNWCQKQPLWPPPDALQFLKGEDSRSCSEVCENQGLVCENLHFPAINNISVFTELGVHCEKVVLKEELFAPSYLPSESTCVLQKDQTLYSCASYLSANEGINRICPCRDFVQYQIHMCKIC